MKSGASSLWVLLIRITIAFIVISFAASEMAFADENVDYWAQTSLSEKNLRNYLSQNRCYANENSFLACIASVNSLLGSSEPAKILTNKKIESIPGARETVQVIEGLKIQNYKLDVEKEKSFMDSWKETSQTRDAVNKSWKQVYSLTASKQLSFSALITAALATKSNSNKQQARLADAINAYLQTNYDPHTYIKPKAELNAAMSAAEESYAGIGSQVQMLEGKIVLTPMDGSPAQKAGLKYLDVLTHVDGKSVQDIPFQDIVNKMIKGPENTVVKLTVQRDIKTLDIDVVRGKIVIKNIEGKIISDSKTHTKIGYIKINSFMVSGLCQKFIALAKNLKQQGAESLTLDLRNNGGGLVSEALCMASSYIDADKPLLILQTPNNSGDVLNVDYNNHNEAWWISLVRTRVAPSYAPAMLYNLYDKKPLVFILNAGSASASELLPGVLKAYGRAVVVGEKSFGKGSMQTTLSTTVDGLDAINGVQLMGTIARFHFATGETNQLVGITPDFTAYSKPNPSEKDKFALREADLYPNAIASSVAPKNIPAETKNRISQCLKARNNIAEDYAAQLKNPTGPDYQLITAREVAACL